MRDYFDQNMVPLKMRIMPSTYNGAVEAPLGGTSGLGVSPGQGHSTCIVFLGSVSLSMHPGV